jgi:hypothetical protein
MVKSMGCDAKDTQASALKCEFICLGLTCFKSEKWGVDCGFQTWRFFFFFWLKKKISNHLWTLISEKSNH